MAVTETIPSQALPFAIFVLFFSLVSAILSILVIVIRWKNGARWTVICLCAIVITLSIFLSMIQQVNFIVCWKRIRDAEYENAKMLKQNPSAVLVGTFNRLDTILFILRTYCYNVQALAFLFWAIGLWRVTWNIKITRMHIRDRHIAIFAKIFALLFPVLTIATRSTPFVMSSAIRKFIWTNIVLMVSITIGSIFVILILYKYIHVNREVGSSLHSGAKGKLQVTFRLIRRETDPEGMPTKPAAITDMKSICCDRWLIARFIICFALSDVLQVCVVIYYYLLYQRTTQLARGDGPDYSIKYTNEELGITIPGVVSGFGIFMVFGTTAPLRTQYKQWFQLGRRELQRRHGPIMAAPMSSVNLHDSRPLMVEAHLAPERSMRNTIRDSTMSSRSAWQLPPIVFDEFSENEVLPQETV